MVEPAIVRSANIFKEYENKYGITPKKEGTDVRPLMNELNAIDGVRVVNSGETGIILMERYQNDYLIEEAVLHTPQDMNLLAMPNG